MPVPLITLSHHLALRQFQCGKQGGGPVAFVVVSHRPAAPLLHRQARLGAIQGLDLTLFLDAQHDGWFRQLDLAPFDLLIWPHPAGESSSSMEPPSGLVGTVESVLCFPSRCGNPRCERISISGVSFHRPPFSFFFAPFFFLCACPQFSTEKYRARIA